MARSYDIRELITLPRLDAIGADALGSELLTCAKGNTLAPLVESARKYLVDAQKALKCADIAPPRSAGDRQRPRKGADQAEDAAFNGSSLSSKRSRSSRPSPVPG